MYDIVLFSHDSSYGGISFIANEISNSCVILKQSKRKDFDDMIAKKFFINNQPKLCKDLLNKAKKIIIFGVISLRHIDISKYKDVTLIISDSNFLIKNKETNNLLLSQKVKVLIMPDLIPFLNSKINYKPYFQCIKIPFTSISKFPELTFCHSPGLKYKSNLKGSNFIEKTLYNKNLIIIKNKNWNECVDIKSKTHVFIDQMIDNSINTKLKRLSNYKGGIGKSGLEAMLLKNLLITSAPSLVTEPYFENPPSINIKPSELKNIINEITCIKDIEDLVQKQHEWARKYTSPSFVTKNILQ